ncbi:Fic family protein [Candidatus Parcubacteria bacterium]|nr:Fic family protein [Candidatus Parcubacteria bacterium]
MNYPKIKDYYDYIFDDIRGLVYDDKQKPFYEKDTEGIEKLKSTLDLVKNDTYYPTFFDKAAYIFISLSAGHYFINGNKRLALFSYFYFTTIDDYSFKSLSIKTYKKWFKKYFANFTMSSHDFQYNVGWALYNFNRVVNIKYSENKTGHQYNFDELKNISVTFFKFITKSK